MRLGHNILFIILPISIKLAWGCQMFWWETIKSTQGRLAATNASESILISILYFIGLIPWSEYRRKKKRGRRGRPYVYPPTVMLRCFVVRMWLRLDSNRALHDFLAMDCYPYNRKIMKACGLTNLPDRRTFDRRAFDNICRHQRKDIT